MSEAPNTETVEIGELSFDEWNEYALAQGWGDGFPLMVPTEDKVAALVGMCRSDDEPFPPMSPRRVVPTLQSIAANAAMAVVGPHISRLWSQLFAVSLKRRITSMGPWRQRILAVGIIVCGPIRHEIGLNCGSNCSGQGKPGQRGHRPGHYERALLNVGGAKPGEMDRSTQGSPAKFFSFCFGENEEESRRPYHVRRGFAADEPMITVSSSEPPHNINDHASTSGEGILQDDCRDDLRARYQQYLRQGPYTVALGPEHAETMHRDGFT